MVVGPLIRGSLALIVGGVIWNLAGAIAGVPILFVLLRMVAVLMFVAVGLLTYAMVEEALEVKRQVRDEALWRARQANIRAASGKALDLVRVTEGEKAAAFWEAQRVMVYRTQNGVLWEIPEVGFVKSHFPNGQVVKWCVEAKGVPATDRMLAILLMLQTDEAGFARVANQVG